MKTDPLNIAIIGSTGSLGRTILDVIDSLKEEINIVALGTGSNVERLKEQVSKYRPNMVSIAHGEWDSSDSDVQLVSASELVTADEVDVLEPVEPADVAVGVGDVDAGSQPSEPRPARLRLRHRLR